ncbi:VOC family protein [uncultured Gimesia sp.]|uniref:VOC family protein n=1 Tax=uncultured Gimesia sp. TaxID=1678688 RepID=UPI0030D7323D|tara:strand:- start:1594 stop:1947 length:354 start_codon:yes stop_codon:yes gene_type:complete
MEIELNLLVLRCRDLETCKIFYEQLGFSFLREQHKSGPIHYAAELGELVFELYPLKLGAAVDQTRLGFRLSVEGSLDALLDRVKIDIISRYEFQQRRILVVQDPDGRKVELSSILTA